ncbi:SDR family NAD(P)-dependent oxidoreductase [Pseudonocardia sp. ICBG1293]|uniref:SDR family NAD(P)-dependent oxidoreductase n=1 Tax=Pseudonocardia sp. ICBG1293 TaxID=2844382 RepID=UPI001CD00B7F|nr:SDR family NAD(P)-dependent oxidoreductase [Pseudonocardia sp. ICBG1293]
MNILDMTGRVALVTGAGQGVGRQVALHIAAHGGAVVVNDYHRDRAESVAAEITEQGGRAVGLRCDVTDLDEVTALVADGAGRLGPIDVLVNNAGNAGPAENALDHTPVTFLIKPAEGLQAAGRGMTDCPCRPMIWGVLSPWPEGANDR